MDLIHPTAVIDASASVGADVAIGPFAYVGPGVTIGDRCKLHAHVTITGPATIGSDNEFFPQCVIGSAPQDLKYRGEESQLIIGNHNIFREMVTIHRGTAVDQVSGGVTRIGERNLFMVGVHLAHDCHVEDHVILANYVQVAGHVRIENCVNIGGHSAMHHFVTIGQYAYVGGMTRMTSDVPPYMKVSGYDADVRGVNDRGMRRWQIAEESIDAVKRAFRLLYGRRSETGVGRTAEALAELEAGGLGEDPHVRYLLDHLRRQIDAGIFGRARESQRTDSDADRQRFYSPQAAEKSS
jgi:UDP-N-acetylglucosamine acyltransferase